MGQEQSAGGTSRSKASRRKWFAVTMVVVPLVTAALAWLVARPMLTDWARQQLLEQARDHGFILRVTEADYSLTSLRLRNPSVELRGVPGVTLAIQSAQIDLTRLRPTRLQLSAVRVQAVGAPLPLLQALEIWKAKYLTRLLQNTLPPPEVDDLQFNWRATMDGPALLRLDGVTWARSANATPATAVNGTLTAARVTAGSSTLRALSLAVHYTTDEIALGFGATQLESAPMRAGFQRQADADDLYLSFTELPLGPMLASLGAPNVDANLAAVRAKGRVSLRFPHDERLHYLGRVELDLRGWVPPHPAELDGFVFGNTTNLQADIAVERSLTQAQLSHLGLSSGALKLAGHGVVELAAMASAHLKAQLNGQLPCSTLASAVVESKLGQVYGRWAASHAGQTVAGNVAVTIQIDANSAHLDQIKIAKRIGVGCGLKPLTLGDALALGLPPMPDADFLQHATRGLPSLDKPLPSVLPGWPSLPDWKLPHVNR